MTISNAPGLVARLSGSLLHIIAGCSSGSGFVVAADGVAVTNAHVVGSHRQVQVVAGRQHYCNAYVLAVDEARDLALLRVDSAGELSPMPLGESAAVRPAESVLALGFPEFYHLGDSETVTRGIVSAVRRIDGIEHIQTDAAINPGNSGGPLIDQERGTVIGVNTFSKAGADNIAYAVNIDEVKDMAAQLTQGVSPMSIQDTVGVYDQAEFADNPEARCSIVLILDVSRSMTGPPVDTVNRALIKFRDIIREDSVTALRADVAVIAFDHEARVVQDFTNGTDFDPPTLAASGGTNYSKAINLALDIIEARKQSYRDSGIAYYRSLAYFLTDGYPEHDTPADLAQAAARLSEMEQSRGVAFFSFGISEPGYPADLGELAKLAPPHRQPQELTNMEQLDGSIQWLSRSVAAVSQSQPGENIRLPEPDYLDF